MISILDWQSLDETQRRQALLRANNNGADVTSRVADIIDSVRRDGDGALRSFTAKFDGFDGPVAFVPKAALQKAVDDLPREVRRALEVSIDNVTQFHAAQQPVPVLVETQPGVVCELLYRPIEKAGLYIPAGSAPLVSTLIMCAVPATVAGCAIRMLCSPPRKDGSADPTILAAASLCGITKVLPLGGAQAVAAMAFGTTTVPKVDKIYGPGNAYVTRAKQLVAQDPNGAAIDIPAGPSEVLVIAGDAANPAWIAADMLAQAEHNPDSQAVLVTPSRSLAAKVQQEIEKQTPTLSRNAIIREALPYCRIVVVTDWDVAVDVANLYAPEHLILPDDETMPLLPRIQHAASVFMGPWSPETAGDYASGTNHVLPNYGAARAYGSLSLKDFMKSMSVQTLTRQGLQDLAPSLLALATVEGLDAHARAVTIRLEDA